MVIATGYVQLATIFVGMVYLATADTGPFVHAAYSSLGLDTDMPKRLLEAGNLLRTFELRQTQRASPRKQVAYCNGWIARGQLQQSAHQYSRYDKDLASVVSS